MKLFNLKLQFIILAILLIIDCGLGGYIAVWREWYWDALAKLELVKWIGYIVQFSVIALLGCLVSGYSQFLMSKIGLIYRAKLTQKLFKSKSYQGIEGGAQRIQEDCLLYPQLFLALLVGLIRAVILIGIYTTIIIVQLDGPWLAIAIFYAILGTVAASKIAKPLINLNYINQVLEAKFRQIITKSNFVKAFRNNFNLYVKLKYLQYFQSFYNQITIIIPHIILAPLYFTSKITFGIFMQAAASLAELINSMSFIVNSFSDINRWLSCRRRLKELKII